MARRTTGEFTQFSLNTGGILYKNEATGALEANTAKTLASLNDIVRGLEKTIRSSTGEKGFNVNRNLISVDPSTQIGQVKFNVDKKYEDIVRNAIENFEARSNLTGDASHPLTSSMQVEDLVKLEYTKSNILGAKARNKAITEADKAGGYAETLAPTAKSPERMKLTLFATQSELAGKTDEQLFTEAFSGTKALSSQERKKRKLKDDEKAKAKELAERKASRKKTLALIGAISSVLVSIADITRRILTASLARASEARKEAIEARTVGMTYIASRELATKDVGHGLAQGTTMGAIQDIQAKFGDVTKLDEQALATLARVMGSGVTNMVTSGMGGAQPDVLLANIMDKFFENFKQGRNSLGQMVGQEQAKRELTTILREISPQIASIFSTMANDWQQGIYAGKFGTYAEYQGLVKDYKMGLTEGEFNKFTELGTVVDQLKAKFMNLKDDILVKFGNVVSDLVVKVNNTEFGMSGKEKVETRAEKLLANKADAEKARMGMKVADVGVKNELARYGLTLEQFGVSSGAELYDVLAGLDLQLEWQEGVSEEEYQANMAKYSGITNIFRRGQGQELYEALITSKAYASAEAIARQRASVKSGKVDYDPILVTEAGIRVASMELDNQFHTTFAQDYDVSMRNVFEEYQKTYGMFNATEYGTDDKFIKALASIANKKLKKAGRAQIGTKRLGGLKDTKDLTTLNNLISEGFLTSEDLASAFSQAGSGLGFNYAKTASTMQASIADKAKESQDEYAKVTDAVREFVTQNYANLEKAYTSGYTVDKAVSVYGTKGTNELNVTLNLVDPQGKKQTLRTTIHTDMNESINVQRNLDMSVVQ